MHNIRKIPVAARTPTHLRMCQLNPVVCHQGNVYRHNVVIRIDGGGNPSRMQGKMVDGEPRGPSYNLPEL